jgi:imidazolonepropionase-like amidohydrolase
LVDAGLTPFEALQTATINPARFLNRVSEFGSIERGKRANLVLLDADPTRDITNTRRLAGVIIDGKYLSRDELDRMLRAIETAASNW